MGILKGSVVCHTDAVCANYVGSSAPLINIHFAKARNLQSGFWGSSCRLRTITRTYGRFLQPCKKKLRSIQSSFSSSSDGNGSIAGNYSENDEEYINSSVIEAGNLLNHHLLFPYSVVVYRCFGFFNSCY